MKKYLVLIFILIASVSFSQDIIVKKGINRGVYTGSASDTINGATTTDAVFYIEYAAYGRYTLSYYVSGDTLNGCSGNVTIQPRGSYDGVTYSNLGSSVTWTTTADYDGNTSQNTYTVAESGSTAQHTRVTAAYDIYTLDSLLYDDTLHVPQQTQTVAAQTWTNTNTVTLPGTDYPYLQILLTGASGARVELQKVVVKVTPLINNY